LTREVYPGRSVCRINGRTYPLNILREFGERVVNIYGQHDFQVLLKPENHLKLLDGLLPQIADVKTRVRENSRKIANIELELAEIAASSQDAAKEMDYLIFQKEEIDKAGLNVAEEDEIVARHKFLSNVGKISSALASVYEMLYGGRETASDILAETTKNISTIADYDDELARFTTAINDLSAQNDDLALEIKSYLDQIEYDPHELEDIEDRIYLIKSLKKKYGATVSEILIYREEIEKKLYLITNKSSNISKLSAELIKVQNLYSVEAALLTKLRKQASETFSKKVNAILKEMNMNADLEVRFNPLQGYAPEGQENAEFYIMTNLGETHKPLIKIASGGELARLMLAMRTVLNIVDPVPTLIFDEVDAGMGGITLSKVAEKIGVLAKEAQILCVTHAAQLAAKATHQFKVFKEERAGKTITEVVKLHDQERVNEIARMLDGKITSSGVEHARELLGN
jgi:DNA repair protein RecN (Recombination protein N)